MEHETPQNEPAPDPADEETGAATPSPTININWGYNQASLRLLELRLRRLVEDKQREAAERNRSLLPVPVPGAPVTVSPTSLLKEADPKLGRPGLWWPFPPMRERLRLAVRAEQEAPAVPPSLAPAPHFLLSPTAPRVSDEQIQEAAQERGKLHTEATEPPAAVHLADVLGLSPFERDTLLLCAAPELRTDFTSLCADANAVLGLPDTPFPTFTLALAVLEGAAFDVLSPQRPLRYWRLVEPREREGGQPLVAAPLRVDERIVNALRGLDDVDVRLSSLLRSPEPWTEPLAPGSSQAEAREEIVWGWQRALENLASSIDGLPVVQLLGPDTPAKIRLAGHTALSLGRFVYRLSLEELSLFESDLESTTRLLVRESHLLPIAVYVDAHHGLEGGSAENNRAAVLRRFLRLTGGHMPLFLGVREAWERDRRNDLAVEAGLPTAAEQRAAWAEALGEDAADLPDRLAAQFRLDTPDIHTLAAEARFEAQQRSKPFAPTLWNACRDRVRPRLDALAHRIEAKARMEDLVLPGDTFALIQEIAAQVAQRSRVYTDWGFAARSDRGLGISVLFAGESGTGKTMAAEALANHLHLSLYRIDLSSVVSKYIGETEENLRKVFDAAEEGGVVLFFDEADALFGKRTEVKDSHDRYANIEVNYLLQRMEAYQGLAVLATNRKSAVDTAFLRRLRFLVTFPLPGVAERKRLWERAFPPDTPCDALDTNRLARLVLSGGNIQSIAVNAAFLAADAAGTVTMPLILRATRNEYVKMERSLNEADFR